MATSDTDAAVPLLPSARDYQQEMLEQSMRRNIVVAMDTGSGKTLIAVLRIKKFLEEGTSKVAWFLAPTVMLCEQQKDVITGFISEPVAMISGSLEPNSWKDPMMWEETLKHRVIVSTPQVLLDALHHGYVSMGQQVGLIVFDEAHHVADKHPSNLIMKGFYFSLPPRQKARPSGSVIERPAILGLTASPTFGGDIERAFQIIEANLDSVILAPQLHIESYLQHANRPVFKHLLYDIPEWAMGVLPSHNLRQLSAAVASLDIEEDPYVISLRQQLLSAVPGPQQTRLDQRLSKTISKRDTYTHKGLKDLERAAIDICVDVGPWSADWFINKVITRAKKSAGPYRGMINAWQEKEKQYLYNILDSIDHHPPSYEPEYIVAGVTDKVVTLIECLQMEKAMTESTDETYSCLVFITRRDAVLALSEVLQHHPQTKDLFSIGCLVGSSESQYRKSFLDITRELVKQSQGDTLRDFRVGEKNLIVSTSVAEEGIDIQACGTVIRWDPPPNIVSWAQSRGRARRKKSTFVLMFDRSSTSVGLIQKWEQLERDMTAMYYADRENARRAQHVDPMDLDDDDDLMFRVESTGATLTLDSAVPHLGHFCAILPNGNHVPIYDDDPAEFPEGWHFSERREALNPYQGPFGAKVTLPRLLPSHLRDFSVDRIYATKVSARQHAAFNAYRALYEAGLLNDYLLPLTSVLEPDQEEEVKTLLQDVMKRTGMADVDLQMDPWLPAAGDKQQWFTSHLEIGDLPVLQIFTQVPLPDGTIFPLYPRYRDPITVRVSSASEGRTDASTLAAAREWTRMMFWSSHATRMDWDNLDFKYVLFPAKPLGDALVWGKRRDWWKRLEEERGGFKQEKALMAPADLFGEAFGWPSNIDFVVERKEMPTHRFLGWRHDTVSDEIAQYLEEKAVNGKVAITYPLIHGAALPRRANFLVPTLEPATLYEGYILPALTRVVLSPGSEIEFALLLPSVVRHMSMTMTLYSFKETVLKKTPLAGIRPNLLHVALTAPVSQEKDNYQRLETLGDCALKMIASVSLFAAHPYWHEGYLSRRKDHMVSNAQLAVHAVRVELFRWIIRDRFVARKWKPAMNNDKVKQEALVAPPPTTDEDANKKKKKEKMQLSTKMLADVVESCIGASMETGGWDLALECVKLFGLGASGWKTIPESVQMILERTEDLPDFPSQTSDVEKMMGYTFKRKAYLVEAITHSSSQSHFRTTSYERMEFLGDAVLDWIVTDRLYHAEGKNYAPGHMHLRKSAVVNSHFLAYIALKLSISATTNLPGLDEQNRPELRTQQRTVHLYQNMLHSSTVVLKDQENTFVRFNKLHEEIEHALQHDKVFPWALLTRLQAPKFFSDMVEALLGAIWLDSEGDYDVVRAVLVHLGILPILDRIIEHNVDVQHPVSRLSLWASREYEKVEFKYEKDKGKITCVIVIHHFEKGKKEEIGKPSVIMKVRTMYKGKRAEDEARFHAAEVAVKELEVKTIEQMIEEDILLELDIEEEEEEEEEEEAEERVE